jgi:hypothetical protein
VVDLDPAFGEQLLDVAVGQAVAQVPAHRHHDHVGWEPETQRTPNEEQPKDAKGRHASPIQPALDLPNGERNRPGVLMPMRS